VRIARFIAGNKLLAFMRLIGLLRTSASYSELRIAHIDFRTNLSETLWLWFVRKGKSIISDCVENWMEYISQFSILSFIVHPDVTEIENVHLTGI
jgi:hypothetical protein